MELKHRTVTIILVTCGFVLAQAAQAAEVYRWVDEEGEVHYSESLPPDFKDQGHDLLNERGIVTDEDLLLTPPAPEKKPEGDNLKELPRDSSGLQRPNQLYSDAEMQRRMDNFLMLRYRSEQEIEDAMSVEIKQLAYDRRLLETTRNSMEQSYRGEIREAANKQRAGQKVPENVSVKVADLQRKLSTNGKSLALLEQRELQIRENFGKQLERYRYLTEQFPGDSTGS